MESITLKDIWVLSKVVNRGGSLGRRLEEYLENGGKTSFERTAAGLVLFPVYAPVPYVHVLQEGKPGWLRFIISSKPIHPDFYKIGDTLTVRFAIPEQIIYSGHQPELGDKVYIVEGYADALMLYQAGITNVCALMGTNLTLRKLGLISRYCSKICLCLDKDENEAGQKATDDIVATLYRFNMCDDLSIIDGMPLGTDPDEFIVQYGTDKFLELERTLPEAEIETMCRRSYAA